MKIYNSITTLKKNYILKRITLTLVAGLTLTNVGCANKIDTEIVNNDTKGTNEIVNNDTEDTNEIDNTKSNEEPIYIPEEKENNIVIPIEKEIKHNYVSIIFNNEPSKYTFDMAEILNDQFLHPKNYSLATFNINPELINRFWGDIANPWNLDCDICINGDYNEGDNLLKNHYMYATLDIPFTINEDNIKYLDRPYIYINPKNSSIEDMRKQIDDNIKSGSIIVFDYIDDNVMELVKEVLVNYLDEYEFTNLRKLFKYYNIDLDIVKDYMKSNIIDNAEPVPVSITKK